MLSKLRTIILKNWIYYFLGLLSIFCLKRFYSTAHFESLKWILTPTELWVRILTGVSFIKQFRIGYVSHEYKFIIAPSCAGINFTIIMFATLFFTFIHRFYNHEKRICWFIFTTTFSYLFTIIINGIRIAISIFIPIYAAKIGSVEKYLSPESLHTLLGTVIFFIALLIVYTLFNQWFNKNNKKSWKSLIPLIYYFIFVLGLPLIIRIINGDFKDYFSYSLFIIVICFTSVFVVYVIGYSYRYLKYRINYLINK